jgi:IclR family transcriptional regulator, pca regulon regulatory protein
MQRKQTDLLGSFAKGLAVIEAFTTEEPKLSIVDVSSKTGFDRALARRCLLTLAEHGYADFDGKYFTLTPRVLRLGTSCLAAMPLPRIIQPLLEKLSADIQQSTSASILDGWEIVYVARASQQRLMSINLMAGSRLQASCTSMGRVLLAALPDADVAAILKLHPPKKFTPRTMIDPERLMKVFNRVRKDGFAIADQELETGLRSIAVPLFDARNKVVAALNVGVAATSDDANTLRTLYLDKLLGVQQTLKRLLN